MAEDLGTDDVGISKVNDSGVDERKKIDRKQKKTKKKKKKVEEVSERVSMSNRNNEQHESTATPDEVEQSVLSIISDDDAIVEKKFAKESKKTQSRRNSSVRNTLKGCDDSINMDNIAIKVPRSPKKTKKEKWSDPKTKAKTLESNDKKKKKKKKKTGVKKEEEDESRHKILLERAVKRISHLDMENPTEMLLISGESGLGKTHWVESEINKNLLKLRQDGDAQDGDESDFSDVDQCTFFPVICRGACEIPPQIRSTNNDTDDRDASESSSTSNLSTESFCNNGCRLSRPPMHAIAEALNDLIRLLTTSDDNDDGRENLQTRNIRNIYGGKDVWKRRIEDALGTTEASYLASTGLIPELGVLLDLPRLVNSNEKNKPLPSWDWNSPYKFHRSCLATRDLLRAVSESDHPVIMILSNLHQADEDTYRLLNFLLTGHHWDEEEIAKLGKLDIDENQEVSQVEKTDTITDTTAILKNFFFIGLHEDSSKNQNGMLHLLEKSFVGRQTPSLDMNQEEHLRQNEQDYKIDLREQSKVRPYLTKIHMEQFHRKKVEDVLRSCIFKANKHKVYDEEKTSEFKESVQELSGYIREWTGGNIFYVLQVFEFLKEEGVITLSPSCKWDIDKVLAQSCRWNKSIIGLMAARIDRLPKVVRSVLINTSALRQTYIEFSVKELFHLFDAAYAERGRKKIGEIDFPFESASEFQAALELASNMGFMKRVSCRWKCNDISYRWAFAHTIIRDEAYSLFVKMKKEIKMEIHFRLGTKAAVLAFVPPSREQKLSERSRDNSIMSKMEHDAFKFLAADQLAILEEISNQDCNRISLLFVETAEMCISKAAFCAAIQYLTIGLGILERNERLFIGDTHGLCFRIYLLLARLHSVCTRDTSVIEKSFHIMLERSKNLKDEVMLHQAEIGVLICQNNYQEAKRKILDTLGQLGEKFPGEDDLPETASHQIEKLIQQTRRKDNQTLLQPAHCTDKKIFDVMILLSNSIEISRLCGYDLYLELAMVRMINICLMYGYTPQYSISFAHYGAILMERAFERNDFNIAKEGYRIGQICEKMASVNNFYGGHSLTIFHSSISHWRRPYRRSLGQILSIYNAQLESGDYYHIQFTTFIYIQYHLISGHNLAKLDDNLQLFDILYQDYKMENYWKIELPQRLVTNLLGETSDPFLFYGNTIEDQNSRIRQMEEAGENDAVQLMHLLILFTSIFFHNHELSRSCLGKIVKKKVSSIWKPWIIFFQCFTDIVSLPNVVKKAEKKRIKGTIKEQRDRLLDWYKEGAINCSVMVSLIDAEFIVADTVAKKPVPTLRIKKFYDDAIAVAREQQLVHMEAFCFERASMRLEAAGAEELSAEYIAKAHQSYFEWNAIAKVDDIEDKHGTKLKLSRQEKIVGAGYARRNSDIQYDPERSIGGGRNKIKPINMKKGVAKTAGKVKKIALRRSSGIALRRSSGKSPRNSLKGVLPSPLREKFTRMYSQKLSSTAET